MMFKNNEYGRSMVEMLCVLAVIGVVSVGGVKVISGAMLKQRHAQALSDAMQLADDGRSLVCDYRNDTGYAQTDYGVFLYKSGKYPSDLIYGGQGVFTGILDITYTVATINPNGAFSITIGNLAQDLCVKMLINDWGKLNSSGFTGIKYDSDELSYPVGIDVAATRCSSDANSITLLYAGCGSELEN